jgi:hypothetical protein
MAWKVDGESANYYIRVSKGAIYGFSGKFYINKPPE